jgi:hypothetical protein
MSLKKIERKLKKKPYVPANDDPRAELRRLVQEHVSMTRKAAAFEAAVSDKTRREDLTTEDGTVLAKKGDTIPCRIPIDRRDQALALVKGLRSDASKLESAMLKELRKVPLYSEFLAHVRGCGPVTAAYLVSMVDFEKCTKPSALHRFCGLAVFDGKSERPTRGRKLGYCAELKTRLYQMFAIGIRQNKRHGESKYLTIWEQKKHALLTTRGPGQPDNKSKGWCDDTARRKATGVFLEDLYIVGRTLAGLPVWPSWYAKAMGYEHGGKVAVLQPKMLTLGEALEAVGIAPQAVAAE